MAKQFKGKRAATKEARKILRRQIDKGLTCLEGPRASDARIHSARKQIKMARATLRLLRPELTAKEYRAENSRRRDAAKPLSQARDATVLRQVFDRLLKSAHAADLQQDGHRLDRMLAHEISEAHAQVIGRHGIPHARRLLREARTRTSHWRLGSHGWSTVGTGLRCIYRQGRDALEAVRTAPSDEEFHEWRKQVKYLRHQMQLLSPIWPGPLDALVDELHCLSDHLGDDHDLVVLRAKLDSNGASFHSGGARQAVFAALDRARTSLQQKALRVGTRIYEEPPRLFCTRMRQYWRDWRHESG